MSRGLSNCNPGNIRRSKVNYKGEIHPSNDKDFKQFTSMKWGYRAMFILLDVYHRRYGLDTVRKMISRYAPPSENNTNGYIARVSASSGIAKDCLLDTLSAEQMIPIVCAMSAVENGVTADRATVERGWQWFVRDYDK